MDAGGIVILVIFALGVVSIWPSWRRHWSGPVLALPMLILGLLLLIAIMREGGRYPLFLIFDMLLLGIGSTSIALFLWRRRWRPAWMREADAVNSTTER